MPGKPDGDAEVYNISDMDIPSLSRRTAAYLVDVGFVFGVLLYVSLGLRLFDSMESGVTAIYVFVVMSSLLMCGYHGFCVSLYGKTLGCLMFGLRVVSEDGSKLSFGRASTRGVGLMLPFLLFPIFFLLHIRTLAATVANKQDRFRRSLWDLGSKAVVIKS
jgi:uncharacterized RDD family membrane protein YckC